MRRIEYDPINEADHADAYPARPLLRHAVDFDWENALIETARADRLQAIGMYSGKLHYVLFAALGTEAYAVISFRKASDRERKRYDQAKAQP